MRRADGAFARDGRGSGEIGEKKDDEEKNIDT